MPYVVVLNFNGPVPLRHIIDTKVPYNQNNFQSWYYGQYHKLNGDEFVFCASQEDMLNCVEEAKNREPCQGCHWHHPEDSVVKCSNLSRVDWEPQPECRCGEFIRTEDYKPFGIWAGVADVIRNVESEMQEK